MNTPPRAVYIHVPFCRRRCGYCSFTVVAGRADLQDLFLDALEKEISGRRLPQPVDTIYIGGGTPTEMTVARLDRLCGLVAAWYPPVDGHEWSIEANPIAVDREKFAILRAHGVNRISLGAQSFQVATLKTLERDHRAQDIRRAFLLARDYFSSVSLDLIYGVPGQSLPCWNADLRTLLNLEPDHVSVYGLTYEKGSAFWGRLRRGALVAVDEEVERRMYEAAIDSLTAGGWEHYEVSNFARPGHRCRHNEVYWVGQSYYGAGPGAASYVNGRRATNHRSTTTYLRRVLGGQNPVADAETLDRHDRARELLVFRLRMLDGISRAEFLAATGLEIDALVAAPLRKYLELELLEERHGRIRLTRNGLLLSDAMWPEFL